MIANPHLDSSRRMIARLVLPLFVVFSVWFPTRSYAFAPAAVYAVYAVTGTGTTVAFEAGLTAAAAIGSYLAYLVVTDAAGDKLRVPLTDDTAKAPPAPVVPISAPSENGFVSQVLTYPQATGSTAMAACAGALSNFGNPAGATVTSATGGCCGVTFPGGGLNNCYHGYSSQTICPPGYSASSGACSLSNARAAVSDTSLDVQRSAGIFTPPDSADIDGGLLVGVQQGMAIYEGGTRNKIVGVTANGQSVLVDTKINSNGTTTFTYESQYSDSTNSFVDKQTVTVESATGQVIGKSKTTQPGSVTVSTMPSGAVDVVNTASVTTGTTVSPSQPVLVNFPNDYAKTGEAQTAANTQTQAVTDSFTGRTIDTQTGSIGGDMDNRIQKVLTEPTPPDVNFSWIPSLLPDQVTACEKLPVDMTFTTGIMAGIGGQTDIDVCPYLGGIRDILGWLFWVATVLHVFYRFIFSNGRPA